MERTCDICIVGAGLTGLALAYYLRSTGLKVLILEARDRVGGRIETHITAQGTPIELGATWLGKKHRDLVSLSEELGVDIIPQFMGKKAIYEPISTAPHMIVDLPPNPDPSFRFKLGSTSLIEALKANADCEILLHQPVKSISTAAKLLQVITNDLTINSLLVVSTLPPNLLLKTVDIQPTLPTELTDIMSHTHTWMSESIKIAMTFAEPFWRDQKTSGTIVSNVGPIPEMYDHNSHDGLHFALKGLSLIHI